MTQNSGDTCPRSPVNNTNRLAFEPGHSEGAPTRKALFAGMDWDAGRNPQPRCSQEREWNAQPQPRRSPSPILEVILSDLSPSDAGVPYMDFYPDSLCLDPLHHCPIRRHGLAELAFLFRFSATMPLPGFVELCVAPTTWSPVAPADAGLLPGL
jgi:hypothetical protein